MKNLPPYEEIVNEMRTAIDEGKIRVKDLAYHADVTPNTIHNQLSEKVRDMPYRTARKIIKTLNEFKN